MRKVNVENVAEESWRSPKGTFAGFGKEISAALKKLSAAETSGNKHPFEVEILRIAAGERPYAFHSHSEHWEFYCVLSGRGQARDENGMTPIETGDAFLFRPNEPHQIIDDGTEDLVICVVADNPLSESCHYPDSKKWLVYSPERRLMRSAPLDYYDGEE